jgi:hypothetical protein
MMQRRDTPLRFLLFPMAHVAAPSFYAEVRKRLSTCDLIVAEGVSGRSRELGALTLAYRLSACLRRSLCLQDYATLLPPGVPVVNVDLSSAEVVADLRRLPRREYWQILALAPLFGLIFAVRGPRAFFGRFGKHLTVDLPTTLRPEQLRAEIDMDKMLRTGVVLGDPFTASSRRREARVLEELTAIHEHGRHEPRTVAVVYGAAHMPVIGRSLMIRHGYRPRQAERLMVFDRRA